MARTKKSQRPSAIILAIILALAIILVLLYSFPSPLTGQVSLELTQNPTTEDEIILNVLINDKDKIPPETPVILYIEKETESLFSKRLTLSQLNNANGDIIINLNDLGQEKLEEGNYEITLIFPEQDLSATRSFKIN